MVGGPTLSSSKVCLQVPDAQHEHTQKLRPALHMFVAGNKPQDVHAATEGSSQGPRMADPSQPIPHVDIEEGALKDYVGQPPFTSDRIYDVTPVGVVMGLAWTAMGGNSLYIEAASVEEGDGKGGLRTTGEGEQLCFSS